MANAQVLPLRLVVAAGIGVGAPQRSPGRPAVDLYITTATVPLVGALVSTMTL
ncbi:MAG: hypothetical protein K8H88_13290 [Sandaracinaceae bacterium]|nr:hypothetical protein [Sandaracinaceae bacterium]